ncbi:MAG: LamG domain-containing protein, partial [Chloroflexi bacterium]|nr:LamG domain-containing protein [Chloroflexota bacterium]
MGSTWRLIALLGTLLLASLPVGGLFVPLALAATPYSSEVLADGPLGYWRLGETSGTAVADASPNGNGGTISDPVTLNAESLLASDRVNASMQFQFEGGGIKQNTNPFFSATDSITVEAWISTNSTTGQMVFSQQRCLWGSLMIYTSGVAATFRVEDVASTDPQHPDGYTVLATGGLVTDGKPHHLVGVRDVAADQVRLYVDGKLVDTKTDTTVGSITSVPTETWIGKRYPCDFTDAFSGRIDEVALYRRALSAERIRAHYAAGLQPPGTTSLGPASETQVAGGDPVNTATGNYTYQHTDVAIPGRGGGLVLARSYNSLDDRDGDLGKGWTHSYSTRLVDNSPTIQVIQWTGRTDHFTWDGSTYVPPAGVFDTLSRPDGLPLGAVWLLTLVDQSKLGFDSAGKLKYFADRYGNQSTLTYTGSQLTGISDPAGRGVLTLGYEGAGPTTMRLSTASDWTGRVVRYGYEP